jgi:hypothetical protein
MAPADWSSAVFCGPAAKGQRLLAEQFEDDAEGAGVIQPWSASYASVQGALLRRQRGGQLKQED